MFDPTLTLDCYYVSVDADRYHRVDLQFVDGTTTTFRDEYSGRTAFGFSGDGRLDTDSETTVDSFYGPIEQATVSAWDRSETVERDGPCVFDDLVFDCDSIQYSRGDDVRVAFVDGSFKQWDPPAVDQQWFGSPGRVVASVTEESVDVTVENPTPECSSGPPATVFENDTVTIGPGEFAGEPTFEAVTLTFVDGSTQTVGTLDSGPQFSAPERFSARGTAAGRPIAEVIVLQQGGDIVFRLVNPDQA